MIENANDPNAPRGGVRVIGPLEFEIRLKFDA
jgi:hypothetical protein